MITFPLYRCPFLSSFTKGTKEITNFFLPKLFKTYTSGFQKDNNCVLSLVEKKCKRGAVSEYTPCDQPSVWSRLGCRSSAGVCEF